MVLNEAIKTGHLNVTFDNGDNSDIVVNVVNVIESISVTDSSQSFVLKVKSIEQNEENMEVPKVENTTQLLALSEYQELRFLDGKIQYVITYLEDIKIIFNFECN